ncbi:PilZ domain-containing protein [Bradyrhizobium sp. SYSU BS000235]|uniref:PilZ domain-containing protein n=1 Tax=Bradyrhizobium sp. SYSU BS000235 TaxID=3411332 RepID=UPI003C725206
MLKPKPKRNGRRMIRHIDAWISPDREQRTECKIVDLSAHGAKLVVPRESAVPRTFTLRWNAAPSGKHCQMVWRNGSMTGVKFLD